MMGAGVRHAHPHREAPDMILLFAIITLAGVSSYVLDMEIEKELMGWLPFDYHQYTTALHGMYEPRKFRFHPVINPIYTSATFQQKEPGQDYGFVYSRIGNPTRESLENVLAKLDYAKYANAFPSGMAAIFALLKMLTPGDHIVCSEDVFDGTYKYVNEHKGVEFDATLVNPTVEEYLAAIQDNTRMIWVESPSNPILKVTDIPKLARAVKRVKPDIIIVLDNTFLGPFFQKGLKLGADVVVYSLSKYMNGHADVIMGAAVTNHKTIHDYLTNRQQYSGMIPSPFDCYQVMRGIKTHPVRMLQHWKNGLRIAMWLEKNPYVESVNYPGLREQSKLPRKMWSGMSGMVSFKLKNFSQNMTRDFLGELRYFKVAWSLGPTESLAEQPYVMLDMSFPAEVRRKLGVTPNLVRLSVGLEYYQDLIDDLEQAMRTIAPEGPPFDEEEYATQDPFNIPGNFKKTRDPRDELNARWKGSMFPYLKHSRTQEIDEDDEDFSGYNKKNKTIRVHEHDRGNRTRRVDDDDDDDEDFSGYNRSLPAGLEYFQDLIDDLDQAMRTIAPEGPPFDEEEYATQDPFDIPGDFKKTRDPKDELNARWKGSMYPYLKHNRTQEIDEDDEDFSGYNKKNKTIRVHEHDRGNRTRRVDDDDDDDEDFSGYNRTLPAGLEYFQDLIDDLEQAMRTIAPEGPPFDEEEYATQDPFDIPGDFKKTRDPRDELNARWKGSMYPYLKHSRTQEIDEDDEDFSGYNKKNKTIRVHEHDRGNRTGRVDDDDDDDDDEDFSGYNKENTKTRVHEHDRGNRTRRVDDDDDDEHYLARTRSVDDDYDDDEDYLAGYRKILQRANM